MHALPALPALPAYVHLARCKCACVRACARKVGAGAPVASRPDNLKAIRSSRAAACLTRKIFKNWSPSSVTLVGLLSKTLMKACEHFPGPPVNLRNVITLCLEIYSKAIACRQVSTVLGWLRRNGILFYNHCWRTSGNGDDKFVICLTAKHYTSFVAHRFAEIRIPLFVHLIRILGTVNV